MGVWFLKLLQLYKYLYTSRYEYIMPERHAVRSILYCLQALSELHYIIVLVTLIFSIKLQEPQLTPVNLITNSIWELLPPQLKLQLIKEHFHQSYTIVTGACSGHILQSFWWEQQRHWKILCRNCSPVHCLSLFGPRFAAYIRRCFSPASSYNNYKEIA